MYIARCSYTYYVHIQFTFATTAVAMIAWLLKQYIHMSDVRTIIIIIIDYSIIVIVIEVLASCEVVLYNYTNHSNSN